MKVGGEALSVSMSGLISGRHRAASSTTTTTSTLNTKNDNGNNINIDTLSINITNLYSNVIGFRFMSNTYTKINVSFF